MATSSEPNPNELVQIRLQGQAEPVAAAETPRLELAEVRQHLEKAKGKQYWRSLDELANHPGFDELMQREFPRHASEWTDAVSRRGFLKLMSASLALAGLAACTKQPEEGIVPYVEQPEDLIPGKPMYFASAQPTPFGANPLLVKSNEFRPTKVDGNPDHAYSQGASDAYAQASILDLYDPDRSQAVTYREQARAWSDFAGAMHDNANSERAKQGEGLRFLTETIVSPTLANQLKLILQQYPKAKWYQYDAVNRDNARAGSRMAFGQY